MELKSIENLDRVNLENCDSEPIHIPGSIQSHGFLLATDDKYNVVFCSNNLQQYQFQVEHVLNHNLNEIFADAEYQRLAQYLQTNVAEYAKPYILSYNDQGFSVIAHKSAGYWILEFEPLPAGYSDMHDIYLQTRSFTELVSKARSLRSLCQSVSDEIKRITGYDRVMVYKFDAQYNGEIFAESKNEELESFLGLHYPHTDIPVQARILYLTNLMRMIADVNYKPVPIITYNQQASNQNLDLSKSVLRSVSPIHIEYLQNMGVSATLTISLIKDDKLWGLIACHHYSSKNIPHGTRLSALLQGHFLTSQIRVQETAEEYEMKMQLDASLQSFLETLSNNSSDYAHNIVSTQLVSVTRSNGVALVDGNTIYTNGDVPSEELIHSLIKIFGSRNIDMIASDNVLQDFGIRLPQNIAGLLYHKMDATTAIIWFRNEMIQEINWAGEPAKAIVKDKNGLSPRKSFSIWKEKVSGFSNPWLQAHIDVANQCVYALQKYISISRSRQTELRQQLLLDKLKEANDELENLNWISTHDLKEPLRKISVFSSLLQDDNKFSLGEESMNIIRRIARAADRMQMLMEDLLAYSKIKNTQAAFEDLDLDMLLNDILDNYEDTLAEKQVDIKKDHLPVVSCIPFLIKQLFQNLINNAIKFSGNEATPEIKIGYRAVLSDGRKMHEITIQDNGIGFDNKYNEVIFQVFQRLDKALDFYGTGMGLAICKKILDLHDGKIIAEGELNKGARFTVLLPA